MTEKQEPVAWMYRREYDGWIQFSLERDFSRMPPFTDEGVWTETPLYTRANRPADDGLVEIDDRIARWLFNLELELSGGSLAPLEGFVLGGDSFSLAELRDILTEAATALRAQSDAEVEREAVVQFLKAQDRRYDNHALCLAVRIEAGEHRKDGV